MGALGVSGGDRTCRLWRPHPGSRYGGLFSDILGLGKGGEKKGNSKSRAIKKQSVINEPTVRGGGFFPLASHSLFSETRHVCVIYRVRYCASEEKGTCSDLKENGNWKLELELETW